VPPADEFKKMLFEHPESWSRAYLGRLGIDHPDLLEAKLVDRVWKDAD
jgi:hypothetical protein